MIKKIAYYIMIVIGIFGVVDSFFIARISSGITLGTILPGMIGVALIIFSVLKLIYKDRKIIKNKTARRTFIILFCLALALFIFIEANIIASYGFQSEYESDATSVIVLGCGIFSDGTPTLTLQKRLNVAYDYLIDNADATCIVSGGKGPNEPYSEAKAMKEYLIHKGIEENRIIIEPASTSTSENLRYSKKIIKDNDLNGKIAIVTSEFHMFRTKFLAKRYDMGKIICLPTDTSWYLIINVHLREFVAVLKSFILD